MVHVGDLAPTFALPGVDGRTYSVEDFRENEVLVVIFSCNHCPYVQAYEDRLIAVQRDYAARGVQVIAINPNDDAGYPEDGYDKMVERAKRSEENTSEP